MANTGYKIQPQLKKVTDDVNEYPLDVNNMLVSVTGLPQSTMANPTSSPTYRVLSDDCPLPAPTTLRTAHNLGSDPHYNEQTVIKVNGAEVYRGSGTYTSTTDVSPGDTIRFEFTSSPDSLPWAPEGGLNASIKVDGVSVYNTNLTTQTSTLGFYEFTVGSSVLDISLEINPTVTGSVWKIRELHVVNAANLPLIRYQVHQNPSYRLIADLDIINGSYYIYYNMQDTPGNLVTITNDHSVSVRMIITNTSTSAVLYDNTLASGQTVTDISLPTISSTTFTAQLA